MDSSQNFVGGGEFNPIPPTYGAGVGVESSTVCAKHTHTMVIREVASLYSAAAQLKINTNQLAGFLGIV